MWLSKRRVLLTRSNAMAQVWLRPEAKFPPARVSCGSVPDDRAKISSSPGGLKVTCGAWAPSGSCRPKWSRLQVGGWNLEDVGRGRQVLAWLHG